MAEIERKSKLQLDYERELAKGRLLMELTRHIGKSRAIGMGELYEKVFERSWNNRINDTRGLRDLLEELRWGDNPQVILSSCSTKNPGYYLPAAGSETQEALRREKRFILRRLARLAKWERCTLADLVGQLALNLRQPAAEAEDGNPN